MYVCMYVCMYVLLPSSIKIPHTAPTMINAHPLVEWYYMGASYGLGAELVIGEYC